MGESQKSFWATVNRAAFGEKGSGWLRKAVGVIIYPYHLLKYAVLWIRGKKEGFKALHPLAKESQAQIMARIESLNRRITSPDLRFNFSGQEVQKAGLSKNQLLKLYDSLVGAEGLISAKTWKTTAEGLEKFLAANGKNNGHSCANISFTHSQKLANGAPVHCRKIPEALVRFHDDFNLMFLHSPELEAANALDYEALLAKGGKKLLDSFKIRDQIHAVQGTEAIEKALAQPGSQAFLFDLVGKDKGHVTLAVNLKGRIYHIDNFSHKSAGVSDLKTWFEQKNPDQLWYGLCKEPVHPAFAQP
ncbi:hypothetical protein [Vampirovibrio sp.]|uniref:hypothetical protein n=1 Tax=Vampirovibrio sp. TaxID=2717857 RepID=UPI00359387D2